MAQRVTYKGDFSVPPPNVLHGISIVEIIVGKEQASGAGYRQETKKFAIHTNLLCSASEYFNAAFRGSFIESTTNQMTLEDEDPDLFDAFYCWLYRLPLTTLNHSHEAMQVDDSVTDDEEEDNVNEDDAVEIEDNDTQLMGSVQQAFQADGQQPENCPEDLYWLKVYRMADRLLVPGLQVAAWDKITDIFSNKTQYRDIVPSLEFLSTLFWDFELGWSTVESEFENFPGKRAIQMWVVEHVNWAINLPNLRAVRVMRGMKKDGLMDMITKCRGFSQALALSIVGHKMRMNKTNPHPSIQKDFAKRHGFDVEGLRAQVVEIGDDSLGKAVTKHVEFASRSSRTKERRMTMTLRSTQSFEEVDGSWNFRTPRALKRMKL